MKYQLAFAALVSLAVCLHAAPPRWAETQQDLKAEKPLDIFSDCSGPHAKAKLRNVIIVPDPPRKGSAVNITADVILLEDVTKGKVKVLVTLDGFLPIINQVFDLCDLLKEVGEACPLKKGPYPVGPLSTPVIPKDAPGGDYSGRVEVMDQNGDQVYCIKGGFKL